MKQNKNNNNNTLSLTGKPSQCTRALIEGAEVNSFTAGLAGVLYAVIRTHHQPPAVQRLPCLLCSKSFSAQASIYVSRQLVVGTRWRACLQFFFVYGYSVVDYSFDSVFFFGSVLELKLFFNRLFDPFPPGVFPFQQGHVKNVMDSPVFG